MDKLKWLIGCLVLTLVALFAYAAVYKGYPDDFSDIQSYQDGLYQSTMVMFAVGDRGAPKTPRGKSIIVSQVILFWFAILCFTILILR